uniref:Uncharacterized protein n=1 Tax=Oryza punctata TaxID=4537 RepID=A0A0E0KMS4_ORYPU
MDDVVVVVDAAEVKVKPATAREPSRQGSLRLRELAPASIDVRANASAAAAAEVIPLLTPLHVVPVAPASDQLSGGPARHLTAAAASSRQLRAEVVAGGGRCIAVEKTRLPAWWWHPAMPPFVNDQPASASASVGFAFRHCV